MKQLVILSGKGGTGKTTVAAALAHLASQEFSLVLADADVDAANLELVLAPTLEETHEFHSGQVAVIDPETCIACGRCAEVCRFDAVVAGEGYRVDPLACEGCATCFYQCPVEAIRMEEQHAGRWFVSNTRFGSLYHAHLFAGQENSGKLVTLVKQMARLRAMDDVADLVLVDGPPGIGCPVISAVSGADLALIVTEPTVSGVHDMARILATTTHFQTPALVLLNKTDLSPARAGEIIAYCEQQGTPVLGQLPFSDDVPQALVRGQPVTAYSGGPVAMALQDAWARLREALFSDEV
ncbi:MAG: ATP-binding protein [Anaerolineae bacterium]|nr:ATP-binding protein [Anaerolineae bacterium]